MSVDYDDKLLQRKFERNERLKNIEENEQLVSNEMMFIFKFIIL